MAYCPEHGTEMLWLNPDGGDPPIYRCNSGDAEVEYWVYWEGRYEVHFDWQEIADLYDLDLHEMIERGEVSKRLSAPVSP